MSITRGDMRTTVGRRLGDTSATTNYSTAHYNDIIDSRTKSLAGQMAKYAPNYYLEHTTYEGVDDAIDSAYEFYQVPNAFRTFIRLWRVYGTGSSRIFQTVPVVNAENQEEYSIARFTILTLPDSTANFEQTVSLWNTKIRIFPAPRNNSYVYRMAYLRQPIVSSADESLLDIPDEWGELLALECAIFIMTQTGDPLMSGLMTLRNAEMKNIKDEYRRRMMDTDTFPALETM